MFSLKPTIESVKSFILSVYQTHSFWISNLYMWVVVMLFLSILSLPIDAFIGLFPSSYRPLSIIFLMLAFPIQVVLLLKELSWRGLVHVVYKRYGILILFMIVSIGLSLIQISRYRLPYDGLINATLTLGLGGLTYASFDLFFRFLNQTKISYNTWMNALLTLVAWVYIPLVIFGLFEILIFFQVFPLEFKEGIVLLFSRKAYTRIQWFSGEPSWASMQMIFSMPFILYKTQHHHFYKWMMGLSMVVLVLSFSMQGLFTFVIAGFIAVVLLKPKWIFKMIVALTLLLIISLTIYYLATVLYPRAYFLTRIRRALNVRTLMDLVYVDGSVAVRLMYPWIGLVMFAQNPIIGVGAGNYRYFFAQITRYFYPRMLRINEVNSNIVRVVANPKNIFTRILGEGGIVSSSIFLWFVWGKIKTVWQSSSPYRNWLMLILIVILSNMLQFDSYAYVPLWFILALFNNHVQEKKAESI